MYIHENENVDLKVITNMERVFKNVAVKKVFGESELNEFWNRSKLKKECLDKNEFKLIAEKFAEYVNALDKNAVINEHLDTNAVIDEHLDANSTIDEHSDTNSIININSEMVHDSIRLKMVKWKAKEYGKYFNVISKDNVVKKDVVKEALRGIVLKPELGEWQKLLFKSLDTDGDGSIRQKEHQKLYDSVLTVYSELIQDVTANQVRIE